MKKKDSKKKFIVSVISWILFVIILGLSAGSADWWINFLVGVFGGFLVMLLIRSFMK